MEWKGGRRSGKSVDNRSDSIGKRVERLIAGGERTLPLAYDNLIDSVTSALARQGDPQALAYARSVDSTEIDPIPGYRVRDEARVGISPIVQAIHGRNKMSYAMDGPLVGTPSNENMGYFVQQMLMKRGK